MRINPALALLLILVIGIVAGLLFDRFAGPGWLSRQIAGSTRGMVTSRSSGSPAPLSASMSQPCSPSRRGADFSRSCWPRSARLWCSGSGASCGELERVQEKWIPAFSVRTR